MPVRPDRVARALVGVSLWLLSACGPEVAPQPVQPSPAVPVVPAVSATAIAPARPTAEPTSIPLPEVDYGTPPPTQCIHAERIPAIGTPTSAAVRATRKYEVVRQILGDGGRLYLELDARRSGVIVPPGYESAPRLVLVVGHQLPKPIPDLAYDKDGLTGTLSFHRHPFSVRVPWTALYGIQEEDKTVTRWREDVPADALCEEEEEP